jgi:hypothetical protein
MEGQLKERLAESVLLQVWLQVAGTEIKLDITVPSETYVYRDICFSATSSRVGVWVYGVHVGQRQCRDVSVEQRVCVCVCVCSMCQRHCRFVRVEQRVCVCVSV